MDILGKLFDRNYLTFDPNLPWIRISWQCCIWAREHTKDFEGKGKLTLDIFVNFYKAFAVVIHIIRGVLKIEVLKKTICLLFKDIRSGISTQSGAKPWRRLRHIWQSWSSFTDPSNSFCQWVWLCHQRKPKHQRSCARSYTSSLNLGWHISGN